MTYYGRWTAKFEKAAELGAAGVLIIHNAKGAAYDWDVVRNTWTKEQCFLPDKNPTLNFQGWLSGESAESVFAAAGKSRAELLAAAETPEFHSGSSGPQNGGPYETVLPHDLGPQHRGPRPRETPPGQGPHDHHLGPPRSSGQGRRPRGGQDLQRRCGQLLGVGGPAGPGFLLRPAPPKPSRSTCSSPP